MNSVSSADQLQQKIAGVCLIVAPLLMIVSSFLEYQTDNLFAAGIIGVVAYTLFIPALQGVARLLRADAPHLSVVGGLIATIGGAGAVIMEAALLFEWAEREAGVPEQLMLAITDVVEGRIFPVVIIFSILFPGSLLALGIGLFRTNIVPKWTGILLALGAVIFPFGRILTMQSVTHLTELLLVGPLIWIGLRALIPEKPSPATVATAS